MIYLLGGYMWLFIHRPFEVWPWLGELRVERVYMLATIAYWALSVEKVWIKNRLNAAFAFFWVALLAAWMASPYADRGSKTVEDYFKVAVFYVLVITSVRDERDLRRLVAFYALAAGLYMLHSLREYYCGRGVWRMGTWRMVGVDATGGDPNSFAATVVYSLTMAWPLWAECRTKWRRRAVAAYVALGVTCVLLTGSRSGFAGLCVLAAIATLFSKHRFKVAIALALAAPLIWACLPEDRQNRFLTLWDPSYGPSNAQSSAEGRRAGFDAGLALWKSNPFLGVGPGGFSAARSDSRHGMQAHNLYGQVLGELGTFGTAALLAVVLALTLNTIQAQRTLVRADSQDVLFCRFLIRAVAATVVLLLLFGWGGHNLYRYTWLWYGAFQVVAVSLVIGRSIGKPSTLASPPPLPTLEILGHDEVVRHPTTALP